MGWDYIRWNHLLGTVVVCPLTSRIHPRWPSRIQIHLGAEDAEIAVDQIRAIDKKRILDSIGRLDEERAAELRHLITRMYGVLSAD